MKKILSIVMISLVVLSTFSMLTLKTKAEPEELVTLPAGAKNIDPSNPELDETRLLINVDIDGQGQTAYVDPGETVSGSLTYQIYSGAGNPAEINQGFFIRSWTPSWSAPSGYYIPIWNGISGVYPGVTNTESFSFTAPSTPGTYYLYWCGGAEYSMADAVVRYDQPLTTPAHAKIVVSGEAFRVLWRVPVKDNIGFHADAGDVDGDGVDDVVIVPRDGHYGAHGTDNTMQVIKSDGTELWSRTFLIEGGWAHVADIDGDGKGEVFGSGSSEDWWGSDALVYAFDDNGDELWRYQETIDTGYWLVSASHFIFTDIDSDSLLEMIIRDGGYETHYAYALDGDGSTLWRFDGDQYSDIVFSDVTGDGVEEIILPSHGTYRASNVYVLDKNGNLIWNYPTHFHGMSWYSQRADTGDLTGDGVNDIAVVADGMDGYGWANVLYVLRNDGTSLWSKQFDRTRADAPTNPVVTDVDGNGISDIILFVEGEVRAYKHDGSLIWSFPHGFAYSPRPNLFDIDRNGEDEIIFQEGQHIYELSLDGSITSVGVLENEGRLIGTGSISSSEKTSMLASGDVNNDGFDELIIQEVIGGQYYVAVVVPPLVAYTVSLSSSIINVQNTEYLSNFGTITFDDTTYALPGSISKDADSYTTTANPPDNYVFHQWQYSGGVSVLDENSQTTTVTISSDGELKAVFKPKEPHLGLMYTYFPHYRFSFGEDWYPCSFYFDDDDDVNNNTENYKSYWMGHGEFPPYYIYIHEVEDDKYLALQYWMYYAYSEFVLRPTEYFKPFSHPHDWDTVIYVVFDKNNLGEPIGVYFFAHGAPYYLPWTLVMKEEGTNHPLVFVALGTHAAYPREIPRFIEKPDIWLPGGTTLGPSNFSWVLVFENYLCSTSDPEISFSLIGYNTVTTPGYGQGIMHPGIDYHGGYWPNRYPGVLIWTADPAPWHRTAGDPLWKGQQYSLWDETRPRPRYIKMAVGSPVDIHVYDFLGRHIGKNYETGEIEVQIPNATYEILPDEQAISVEVPALGDYKIELIGTGDGNYTFFTMIAMNGTWTALLDVGETVTDAVYVYNVSISDEVITANPEPAAELEHLKEFIDELLDDAFDKPELASQRKNALFHKIDEVILKVEVSNYTDAINKLLHDIRAKMDGDSTAEDWIMDPEMQSNLCVIIDHIISSIETSQQA